MAKTFLRESRASGSALHKVRRLIAGGWYPGGAIGPLTTRGTRRQRRKAAMENPNFNLTEEINETAAIEAV